MNTKWQMNPTSRVSSTAFQAGENSQTNGVEHTIVSSILTDLIFKRSNRTHHWASEAAEFKRWLAPPTSFEILNWHDCHYDNTINSNINLDLGLFKNKNKKNVFNPLDQKFKIQAEESMNQSVSNPNIESPLAGAKLRTNWSNNEPNNITQLWNFHENQIMKDIGISYDIFDIILESLESEIILT